MLGRTGQDVVVLDSPTVSRHHAVVRVSGDHATIEDLGSKNGTWLGDDRVTTAPVTLEDGQELRLGSVLLRWRGSGAARPRPRSGMTRALSIASRRRLSERPGGAEAPPYAEPKTALAGRRHDRDAQSPTSPTAASAGARRLISTLSMRRPSMSTTSKRMPPHSKASAVRGMRPRRAMTKPPSVW